MSKATQKDPLDDDFDYPDSSDDEEVRNNAKKKEGVPQTTSVKKEEQAKDEWKQSAKGERKNRRKETRNR